MPDKLLRMGVSMSTMSWVTVYLATFVLLGSFMSDYLLLNVIRTKELVVDFSRTGIGTRPGIVEDYKYLHVHLNDGLDWSTNTDAV